MGDPVKLNTWLRRNLFLSGLLSLAMLSACSDASPTGKDTTDAGALPVQDWGQTPPKSDVGVVVQDQGTTQPEEDSGTNIVIGARELQVVGATQRLVERGQQAEFKFKLVGFDVATQREVPVPNERIALKMLNLAGEDITGAGMEGSQLSSARAETNAQGEVAFNLRAGNRDAQFKLRAEVLDDGDVAPVTVDVTVARAGMGSLAVKANYAEDPGRYRNDFNGSLLEVEVALFGQLSGSNYVAGPNCTTLEQEAAIFNPPMAQLSQRISPFDPNNDTANLSDEDGNSYTVLATLQKDGKIVGYGCLDAAEVEGGKVTQVTVNVYDLPLSFGKPPFKVRNQFDLQDLLESASGTNADGRPNAFRIVSDILTVMRLIGSEDPSRGQQLVAVVCDYFNDNSLCDVLERMGNALIIRALDMIPPNVMNILNVISDVLTVISDMTIVGELEFQAHYPDDNLRLVGENMNRWERFNFVWRNNCPAGANCERSFPIQAISVQGSSQRIIEGAFEATIDGDKLYIEAHGMRFQYGLLILAIAEQWIFPAILQSGLSDPVSLEEFFGTVLEGPCTAIDDFIGTPGLCQDMLITTLSALLVEQLKKLVFEPEQFIMQGHTKYLDTNYDLIVDQLKGGQWCGNINIGSNRSPLRFMGCFEGCRDPDILAEGQQPCEPESCQIPVLNLENCPEWSF